MIDKQGKVGVQKLAESLLRNGQALLPMMELIEQSRMAPDEHIQVMGGAGISALSRARPRLQDPGRGRLGAESDGAIGP